MSELKCICHVGFKDTCRVHNPIKNAAYVYANDYYFTNEEILNLEPFHQEVFEIMHVAGQEHAYTAAEAARVELETRCRELEDKLDTMTANEATDHFLKCQIKVLSAKLEKCVEQRDALINTQNIENGYEMKLFYNSEIEMIEPVKYCPDKNSDNYAELSSITIDSIKGGVDEKSR